jgi:hypothetical protein
VFTVAADTINRHDSSFDPLHRSETKDVERERGLCQHESDTERDADERPRMYSCTKEILKLRRVGQHTYDIYRCS